jgi:mannose-1-phosphate guanylyltransferase
LKDATDDDFFVFNSDIICEFPLKQLLEYHKAHKAEGTLMVTRVEDPSRYGVILYREDGLIEDFIEKPSKPISNKINAGLYLLNKSVIERIPEKPTSIEREIFPKMAADKRLYALELQGIWYFPARA